MGKKNAYDRQPVLSVVAELGVENIGTGNEVVAKLPQGAVVVGVLALCVTAFDTDGESATVKLTVSDGTTAFVNAQSVASTGKLTAAATEKHFPTGGTLTCSIVEASADATATEGKALVIVQYVQIGAGGDIYG